jgi:hypothetical protein
MFCVFCAFVAGVHTILLRWGTKITKMSHTKDSQIPCTTIKAYSQTSTLTFAALVKIYLSV